VTCLLKQVVEPWEEECQPAGVFEQMGRALAGAQRSEVCLSAMLASQNLPAHRSNWPYSSLEKEAQQLGFD
jgi:hypothetical protein